MSIWLTLDDDSLKRFYRSDRIITPMTGDIPELLQMAVKYGLKCGFTLSFTHKEVYATPIRFNSITGRLTVRGGPKSGPGAPAGWVRSFLLKQVKMYTFSEELYDAWDKDHGKSRDDIPR